MAFLKHLIEALLNPLCLGLFFFIFLLIISYNHFPERKLFAGFLLTLFLLLAISTGWLPYYLSKNLENRYSLIQQPRPDVHWIVVMGGGQSAGANMPDNMILYGAGIKRLVEGVRLYRELPAAKFILSGGGYQGKRSEASHLAVLLKWFAIPKEDILLETESVNTADEALALKKMLGQEPFYLVTTATHMHRAMLLCKKQGLNPIAAPTDFAVFWDDADWGKMILPHPRNAVYFTTAFHEVLGLAWGKLIGTL